MCRLCATPVARNVRPPVTKGSGCRDECLGTAGGCADPALLWRPELSVSRSRGAQVSGCRVEHDPGLPALNYHEGAQILRCIHGVEMSEISSSKLPRPTEDRSKVEQPVFTYNSISGLPKKRFSHRRRTCRCEAKPLALGRVSHRVGCDW